MKRSLGNRYCGPVAVTAGMVFAFALSGCATVPFAPAELGAAAFGDRALTQEQDGLRMSAAVLGPDETQDLLGIDLYAQGIQPVWISVENRGDVPVRLALWSIDDQYFAPLEVAWANRKAFKKEDRAGMERWFYENAMPRRVPARESRSGLVFTNTTPGTKGFNADLHVGTRSTTFTFFAPLPGFVTDYMDVDFERLYGPADIQTLGPDDLSQALEQLPCCGTDASGSEDGEPLNVALVGTGLGVRRALLRAGWNETETSSSTVSSDTPYYRDRGPDGTFVQSHPDGGRRELRLWLAPFLIGSDLVWLGQARHLFGGKDATASALVDPDLDDARTFVAQSFWYGQSLAAAALVGGVPSVAVDAPRRTFAGWSYFTDGLRVVLHVSEAPVARGETALMGQAAVLAE
jgi:LssY C-terminus